MESCIHLGVSGRFVVYLHARVVDHVLQPKRIEEILGRLAEITREKNILVFFAPSRWGLPYQTGVYTDGCSIGREDLVSVIRDLGGAAPHNPPDPQTPDPQTPDPQTPDPQTPDPQTPDPPNERRLERATECDYLQFTLDRSYRPTWGKIPVCPWPWQKLQEAPWAEPHVLGH